MLLLSFLVNKSPTHFVPLKPYRMKYSLLEKELKALVTGMAFTCKTMPQLNIHLPVLAWENERRMKKYSEDVCSSPRQVKSM